LLPFRALLVAAALAGAAVPTGGQPSSPAASNEKPDSTPALESLVAAERAFAADSVARGIRASFLSAFAEDGINFDPRPQHTRAELLKEPEPETPSPLQLDWHPVWADVSSAGDLGYTTGPYVLRHLGTAHTPPGHGYYFSIWKKQADGSWKVILDTGIRTPAPAEGQETEYRPAPRAGRPVTALSPHRRSAGDDLRAREANLDSSLRKSGGVALADFASLQIRFLRDGAFPYVGKDALRPVLTGTPAPETIDLLGDGMAASGDLGYTWGRETFASGTTGYFVRLWRLDEDDVLRITVDWANSIPKEEGR
jgi:ketosteroid isomerase-like protein